MFIFGKSFPQLGGFEGLVSALLDLVNNTLEERINVEGQKEQAGGWKKKDLTLGDIGTNAASYMC